MMSVFVSTPTVCLGAHSRSTLFRLVLLSVDCLLDTFLTLGSLYFTFTGFYLLLLCTGHTVIAIL